MSRRGNTKMLSSLVSCNARRSPLHKFLNIDCKSGKIDISDARHFFKEMLYMRPPPPNSWFGRLFNALVKSQHFSVPISLYKRLHVFGVLGLRSNFIILNMLLNCYSSMKLGSVGFSAFGVVLKAGYRPTIITFNALVKGLCLEEKLVEAVGLLSKMSRLGCPPDIVTYNTIINGLCKTGNVTTALELHRVMLSDKWPTTKKNCKPSTLSYTLIDGGCIEWPMVDAKGKDARFSPNVLSYNCLIDGLCRLGMEDDAKLLLDEMIGRGVLPDTVTYNIIINTLCKKGKVEEAIGVPEMMISRGKWPNTVTYSTIMDGYCRIGKIETALILYEDMNSRGIFADNVTINTLLKGLFHVKKVGDALSLFKDMKRMDINGACSPDQVTYLTMIDGLCKEGHLSKAEELFLEMQDSGISQDANVYSSLIDGLCKQGHVGKAQKLFLKMLASNVSPHEGVYSALIDGLCKEGDIHKAGDLFLQMQSSGISPDVISYNILIDGFYRSGNVEKANTLLEKMITDGTLPDVVTFKIIIKNLGNKGRMEEVAQNVIPLMESCGYECDVGSYNVLIRGYCKAGMVEDAHNLLVEMEAKGCSPDVVTYSTLISGFAHEKESARVKELIQKMHDVRISSNSNATSALLECINMDEDQINDTF